MTDNIDRLAAEPDIIDAAEQLEALLDLPAVEVKITAVRMVGQGAGASVDVALDNGEVMTFMSVRDMVKPQSLLAELVACSGATPQLKQPQAIQVVRLARIIAERTLGASEDDVSTSWGSEFLQIAETVDFVDDQRGRWGAFELLSRRDPGPHSRDEGHDFARSCIVLRDPSETRLVRSQWFTTYVRRQSPRETESTVLARMARVGWERRGSEGRIKATRPDLPGTLSWAFLIVPAGWEDALGSEQP